MRQVHVVNVEIATCISGTILYQPKLYLTTGMVVNYWFIEQEPIGLL
jgi:hypothetical protein